MNFVVPGLTRKTRRPHLWQAYHELAMIAGGLLQSAAKMGVMPRI